MTQKNKQNKNKIEEMEKKILNNSKTKDRLFKMMDPLVLWIEEMKKSFSSILINKSWDNKITLEMDKFENHINNLKN